MSSVKAMHDILYHRHHLDNVSLLRYTFKSIFIFIFVFKTKLQWDVIYGGLNVYFLYQYDHLEFPGVVPRTFIGKLHIFPGVVKLF